MSEKNAMDMVNEDHIFVDMGANADTEALIKSKCGLMNHGALVCANCGERFPMPGGNTEWVCAVMRAFTKAHENCK